MKFINHRFKNSYGREIEKHEILLSGDICVYCNFIINNKIEDMFQVDDYSLETRNFINLNYKCITQEELIIKTLLE